MTTTTRSTELVNEYEELQSAAVETLLACTDVEWRLTTRAEGWTVAATAHHMAIVQRAFVRMVEMFAAGETYTPSGDMDRIHASNADHAREYAGADKIDTLQILESSGAEMAALMRGLDDGDLARSAGTFGGNDLTVAQVLDYVVIGHLGEHLASIQETIDA